MRDLRQFSSSLPSTPPNTGDFRNKRINPKDRYLP